MQEYLPPQEQIAQFVDKANSGQLMPMHGKCDGDLREDAHCSWGTQGGLPLGGGD